MRYNPREKTKHEQLQLWNSLIFDPQKTDVDQQMDLVLTLGDMLGQNEQAKMDKLIEIMPTMIQTHLIIKPTWADVTKKAEELEHIICMCEALVTALASMQATAAVPSLYSHIAHSDDQDINDIPKPFKSAKGKGGKKSGKGKQKEKQQQPQPPPPPPEEQEELYKETSNYYHNQNYRGNTRGPTGGNKAAAEGLIEVLSHEAEANKAITEANTKATEGNTTTPTVAITIIIIITVVIGVEEAMSKEVTIIEVTDLDEVIIEAIIIINTIRITHDDGSQVEQYGLPCAFGGGFNHSLKHCFKGEHDKNNLMEKMSLGSNNPHQCGLYQ